MNEFAPAGIAALVTFVSTPIVRRVLVRYAILDVPNERSSHVGIVPRGGGIAVAAGAVAAAVAWGWTIEAAVLVAASSALGLVGLRDDRRGLSAVFRLAAQFVVPIAATSVLLHAADIGGLALIVAVLLAAAWCAAYVNAFNFMDGINGLAVGQTLIAGCALGWLAHEESAPAVVALSLAVAGAAIGFAPFNAVRASIFLGDVGSYFFGSWLALLLILVVADGTPLIVALGPLVLYLMDTGTTLVKRFRRGARLFDGHREHAYQLLVEMGWTHARVTTLATGVIVIDSVMLIMSNGQAWWWQAAAMCVALVVAGAFVALPTALATRRGSAVA